MTEISPALTARGIARAAGVSERLVYRLLAGKSGSGRKVKISGTKTRWWTLDDVPDRLRRRIAERAQSGGMTIPDYMQAGSVAAPAQRGTDQVTEELAELESVIDGMADVASPTVMEREAIWRQAVLGEEALLKAGKPAKRAKAAVLDMLQVRVPNLGANRRALAETLRTKRARWEEHEGAPDALVDRRGIANQARRKTYNPDDRDKILWEAAAKWNGKVAPAKRALMEAGELSDQFVKEEESRTGSKSDVRETLLAATALAPTLARIHQGPRAADKLIPSVDVDHSGTSSMHQWQADDLTGRIVTYRDNSEGWYDLFLGQLIIVISRRARRVMGYGFQWEDQPNSLVVRTAFIRCFDEFGIPDEVYIERGQVFEGSKLVTGGRKRRCSALPFSDTEIHQGLSQYGVSIHIARRARSKGHVEGVIRQLQDRMHGLRGFAGRKPDHSDVPDALRRQIRDVETRKEHPAKFFYSMEELEEEVAQICRHYNQEKQEGSTIGGMSPDEAFEQYYPHDNPPKRLDGRLRQLLSTHRVDVVRTGDDRGGGIVFRAPRIGQVRYFGKEIGGWIGRMVTAWFNPECPEYCTFSLEDDMRQIVTLPRHVPVKVTGIDDSGRKQLAAAQATLRPARTLYRTLAVKFKQEFRPNLVDGPTAALTERLEQAPKEHSARQAKERTRADARRRWRGIMLPL